MLTYFVLRKENGYLKNKIFTELNVLIQNSVLEAAIIVVRNRKICAVFLPTTSKGTECAKDTDNSKNTSEETIINNLSTFLADTTVVKGKIEDLVKSLDLDDQQLDTELEAEQLERVLEHTNATPFRKQVWKVISEIPFKETRTYSEIANSIGNPKAVRAVASACGAKDISSLIPCHRVIPRSSKNSNEKYGGYRWGSELKQRILDYEKL